MGRFLREVQEEVEGGRVSGESLLHRLWATLAVERGARSIGEGIRLETLHGAKGMEFNHVILVDDGRDMASVRTGPDARRRAFYVGMTRARRSLCLCVRADRPDPALMALRTVKDRPGPPPGRPLPAYRYFGLRSGELYLDWAGRLPEHDPVHARLRALRPGDPLHFVEGGGKLYLADGAGGRVARLSAEGQARWASRCGEELRLRVLAVEVRHVEQCAPEYRPGLQVERWELPLVEVRESLP